MDLLITNMLAKLQKNGKEKTRTFTHRGVSNIKQNIKQNKARLITAAVPKIHDTAIRFTKEIRKDKITAIKVEAKAIPSTIIPNPNKAPPLTTQMKISKMYMMFIPKAILIYITPKDASQDRNKYNL